MTQLLPFYGTYSYQEIIMPQLQLLQDWGNFAAGFAFWLCLLWPALIRPFWPWNRHEWGWNMVLKTEMIAVALFPAILHYEFGVQPGLPLLWVEVLAVTAIPIVILWRTWIIYKSQKRGAMEARRSGPEREPSAGV